MADHTLLSVPPGIPRELQTTFELPLFHPSSQTVPQIPNKHSSNLPSLQFTPSTSLISPSVQGYAVLDDKMTQNYSLISFSCALAGAHISKKVKIGCLYI